MFAIQTPIKLPPLFLFERQKIEDSLPLNLQELNIPKNQELGPCHWEGCEFEPVSIARGGSIGPLNVSGSHLDVPGS